MKPELEPVTAKAIKTTKEERKQLTGLDLVSNLNQAGYKDFYLREFWIDSDKFRILGYQSGKFVCKLLKNGLTYKISSETVFSYLN